MSLLRARAATKWTYKQAKCEAEARVVRWQWATAAVASLEPCHFELAKASPGKVLVKPPKSPRGKVEQGFDERGELAVERTYTELEGRFYETFYAHRDGGIIRRHFSYEPAKKAINTSFFTVDEGRVTRIDTLYAGPRTHMEEVFSYGEGGRLARMDRKDTEGDRQTFDVEWEGDALVRVRFRLDDGPSSLYFERATNASSLAARAKVLEQRLAKATIDALAATTPAEPVYAIALHWTGAGYQHRVPPAVALATVSMRDRFLAGSRASDFLWNPAEWGGDVRVPLDAELARLCEAVSSDVWQNERFAEADAFVMKLAARVGKSELPIATTKDVVVYAVELDAAEPPSEQLARQLTPTRRAAFAKRRMLG